MLTKIKIKLNREGMTLVEVVVSFAIIAVITTVIIVGFRTMGSIIQDSDSRDQIDQQLEKQIASSEKSAESTQSSITINGETITINGTVEEYNTTSESGKAQSFRVFVPSDTNE